MPLGRWAGGHPGKDLERGENGELGGRELFAEVVVDIPARQLDRPLTYLVPYHWQERVEVGSAVLVPLLRSLQVGYVIGLRGEPPGDVEPAAIKPLEGIIEEPPILDDKAVELCRWISRRYLCPLASAVRLFLPPGRARKPLERVRLLLDPPEALARIPSRAPRQRELVESLASLGGSASLARLRESMGKGFPTEVLRQLERKGLLERSYHLPPPRVNKATLRFTEITPLGREWLGRETSARYPARRRALSLLMERGGSMPSSELCQRARCSPSLLKDMESLGLLEIREEEVLRDPLRDFTFPGSEPPPMTRDQENALRAILEAMNAGGGTVLLHGVTGSGKTEVYLRAIEEALGRGLDCLVLVPEIALTPQMVQRFVGRFRERVAVLHSRLGLGERYDQWRGIREGKYRVVIGARSALFAPLARLGIIVVDEEHETSYKQETSPRYHAVEVAAKRAEIYGAVLVLGSATPRLETLHATRSGEYILASLPQRVDGRRMPQVEIVDMREVREASGKRLLSPRLVLALAETIRRNEQAILFLNRRGFAPSLLCRRCGFTWKCSHCSVSLCWHAGEGHLLCHHCGLSLPHPKACPRCGEVAWKYAGAGTERVEEEIRSIFPHVPLLRMDADTTRRKGSHFRIFREFQEGKARILVGTQMIAKGLDLPSVTLVGIIDADTSLTLPDFRASERTFQLITQVSGRAGRGERPGRVILQSYNPEHYAISLAAAGRMEDFLHKETEFRRDAHYPPFCRLVNFVVSSSREETAREASCVLAEAIHSLKGPAEEVLGPAPAPLSRLKGRYRHHLLVKTVRLQDTLDVLRNNLARMNLELSRLARKTGIPQEDLQLAVDVDPSSLL